MKYKKGFYWAKRPKYGNTPTVVDGRRFDSKLEANRYRELKLLQQSGEVEYIDVHPVFRLMPEIRYEADFMVYYKDGHIEVEDAKGVETRDFRLKRKLFDSLHPLAPLKVIRSSKG